MANILEKAEMNKALVQLSMGCTMMALMWQMHATKIYCIYLNDWMGKAPVRLVYMVPVVASARAAKQNMSCIAQASCIGDI